MNFFTHRYARMIPDFTTTVTVKPALRVNTLKITPSRLVKRLAEKGVALEKVPFLRHGYYYRANFSLGATPEYLLGYYYLQGAASQVVAEVLEPRPGETVLDMAAAPGSKTTHMAQLMRNEGVIVALEVNAGRLAAVRNNCERLLVKNVVLVKKDARFAPDLGVVFEKVLLDAPCSGNFCSEEGWFAKRQLGDIERNVRMQRALLKAARKVLAPGGVLVYSTCSLEPEEDELVIDWFIQKYPDMRVVETGVEVGSSGLTAWEGRSLAPSLALTRRFWPHKTGTEGFFIAKMKKGA